MTDLTQSSSQVVIDLINTTNGSSFTASDFTFGTPGNNNIRLNGQNTIITLTPKGGTALDLPVTETYNRLRLDQVLELPYCQLPTSNPSRVLNILDALNQKYQLNLTANDIADAPFKPTDIRTGIKSMKISTVPTSLVYRGSATVYFGDQDTVDDWFIRPHWQIGSDYSTVQIMGNTYTINGKVVTIDPFSGKPSASVVAAYLGDDGQIRFSNNYGDYGQLVAHFSNGILKEVLGPGGLSAYDATGNLLPKAPAMPTFLTETIGEAITITPALNSGVMSYSTQYDVGTKKATTGQVYYVDGKSGNDLNDGKTQDTAFKSMNRAIMVLPAARTINVVGYADYAYDISTTWSATVTGRSLDIIGIGDVPPVFTGRESKTVSWVNQIDTVFYTNVQSFGAVVDLSNTSDNAGYERLISVKDINTCQTTNSSYFLDVASNRLYVNLFDNRTPDDNVVLVTKSLVGSVADNAVVYMENISFELTYSGFVADMTTPKTTGYIYSKNCTFGWTATEACFNSYGFNVVLQNPVARYGMNGGLRYCSDRVLPSMQTPVWVVELNATVSHCGFDASGLSPASAIRSYVTALRMNSTYTDVDGNIVQDSGDKTQSLNLGLTASSTKLANTQASMYTLGDNSINSAVGYYYSCSQDNSAISFYPKGVGVLYMHDSNLGFKPCYQSETPYIFVYTNQ